MPRSNHYGTPGSRITGAERKRIIAWILEGLPRNEIAKRAKRSGSTISGIAKAEGLEFGGRSQVAAATEARKVDNRARRAALQADLLDIVDGLKERVFAPTEYVDHGGKDFIAARWTQPEPTHADKLKLVQAIASAIGRHLDLDKHDADTGDKPAVDAWLDHMTGGD